MLNVLLTVLEFVAWGTFAGVVFWAQWTREDGDE